MNEAIKAKIEAVIKRTEKFQPLFDSDLFKEWNIILAKKIESYRALLNKSPRVGDVKTMQQVTTVGDRREVTQVPFRITLEEQNEIIGEYMHKIQELQTIIDIPMLMKADMERMRIELEKLNKIGDKS